MILTLPTDGKPISATLASPDLRTSNPSPFSPFFEGSNSCDRYFASFAFNNPKWYSVAECTSKGLVEKIFAFIG